MTKLFCVYALLEPDTLKIRYIGQTHMALHKRYGGHIQLATRGNKTHRSCWIRSLMQRGLLPEVCVLEEGMWSIEYLNERENCWIDFGRQVGWDLTNHTSGGPTVQYDDTVRLRVSEGTKRAYALDPTNRERARQSMIDGGHYEWSEERKAAHSALMTEIMSDPEIRNRLKEGLSRRPLPSEETKKKIGEAQKGRVHRPESIEKMRQTALARPPMADETRKKIGDANRGRKKTPEEIEKTREKNFGRTRTPEQRARMSAAQKDRHSPQEGKPWTEEQKEKARASHRARWERYRTEGRDVEIRANISRGTKEAVERTRLQSQGD